jgi:GNAT superfamily N-acetyltransferase
MTAIHPLAPDTAAEWRALWRGYLAFYETELPDRVTQATWERLLADNELHGALARDDAGEAVGIVHWLTHPATWASSSYCYLEDLFVSPGSRGAGAGRRLISHVRQWASEHDCAKVYWLTREDNATARELYDRVAEASGFVQYQIRLSGTRVSARGASS